MVGKIFKALADGTRREILDLLREGDLSAGDIADHFNMTKPSISHHLRVLKESGLCVERREGQHIIYSLEESSVVEAWDGFLAKFCSSSAERRERQARSREENRKKRQEIRAAGDANGRASAAETTNDSEVERRPQ